MKQSDITKVAVASNKTVINFDGDREQAPVTYKDRPLPEFLDVYNMFKKYFEDLAELDPGSDKDFEISFILKKTDKKLNSFYMIGIKRMTSYGNHNIHTPLVAEEDCPEDIPTLFSTLQKEAFEFHEGKRPQMQLFSAGGDDNSSEDDDDLGEDAVNF